jgi:hypothetical protein
MIKHSNSHIKLKLLESSANSILFIKKYRFEYTVVKLIFIFVAPICLLILPADFFDNGRSICISKLIFGFECYACGMTRGVMHLIHLEFEAAFAYNMLSFLVLPLMIIVWVQWFFEEWKLFKKMKLMRDNSVTS